MMLSANLPWDCTTQFPAQFPEGTCFISLNIGYFGQRHDGARFYFHQKSKTPKPAYDIVAFTSSLGVVDKVYFVRVSLIHSERGDDG